MFEWQPIETAPKDGTVILGYSSSIEWIVVYAKKWRWQYGKPDTIEWTISPGEMISDITHWQPLPKPPTQYNSSEDKTPA